MSLRSSVTFESELSFQLENAGLPTNPALIIRRPYRFGCEHGSHHTILFGTIQAIEVSDEGGLEFYVSSPRFWGARLISIKRSGGKWIAYVEVKPVVISDAVLEQMSDAEYEQKIAQNIASQYFEGEFELL